MSGNSSNQKQAVPKGRKYADGEKILCYHGPLIYEGKCLTWRFNEGSKRNEYHIHYSGWNKNWDEWVEESRVLKHTAENLATQKRLKEAATKNDTSKPKKKKSMTVKKTNWADSQPSTSSASEADKPKKKKPKAGYRKNDPSIRPLRIDMSDKLQDILADDWQYMVMQKKLIRHPPVRTVSQIVEEYIKHKTEIDKGELNKLASSIETGHGVKEYFNVLLNTRLLYGHENAQFQTIMSEQDDEVKFSDVFGPMHLLRMMTKIGWALGFSKFGDRANYIVEIHIEDFIRFLDMKADLYFGPGTYMTNNDDDSDDD